MKKCTECKGKMKEFRARTPEGVEYSYFRCKNCGDEIVDMKQLHDVAQKYREMKRFNAKISKWGMSLGLRIPKELVKKYNLKDREDVTIIPEQDGMKIIPA